ncbi:GntR family transcriptional regulator [Saccharopolyspora erythraea NRRL 2338]|uniref:GntR-family transcriptional regulator n=3 Tax=Saccharopolyspora erythraea TaxID=1836 RepID=A4FP40_SACEN|nr:GntR family transcriptional regulator [Saccharopolyspora erythraea]PFG99456.1 GntR family transcriptional regulator [Saccharopolyspora erythraea NRRL 2338]QRK89365.1 GntR family transcriptional regulator [Saccharopolyspora erythraea]CAM05815.1 putative GntR-family transcriptional regulator [Saccharopolyspora erythraea NRRL 2338]
MRNDIPPHRAGEPIRAGVPEHGRIPRYYAVKTELLVLIEEIGEGACLPAERELAERYGVSRVTLRQAVGELVLEGRLLRRQGSRTVVAPPKLLQPLALVSYTEGIRTQGLEPGRTVISAEVLSADPQLAADLGVEPGGEVIYLERVLLAGGERVGLESSYLPRHRFPRLLEDFDADGSLYAFLQRELGVVFGEAEERIETVLATPREALLIGTNPATPMILLHRVSWEPDGTPIERVRSLFRGDRFSFVTRLRQ